MNNNYLANSKIFKAFCDENRLKIIDLLRTGEKCACVILSELKISQSTLSHHMKILVESGVVLARYEGKWTHYSISQNGFSVAINILNELSIVNNENGGEVCK
jgi:ArsR family transcriptional regulator